MREIKLNRFGGLLIGELPDASTIIINTHTETAVIAGEPIEAVRPIVVNPPETNGTKPQVPVKPAPAEDHLPIKRTQTAKRAKPDNSNKGYAAAVEKLLAAQGALSTSEIAAKIGIERQQANDAIRWLIDNGRAHFTGHKRKTNGDPRVTSVWAPGPAPKGQSPRTKVIENTTNKVIPKIKAMLGDGGTYQTSEIADMVGVNRDLVRNALAKLEREGLVTHEVVAVSGGKVAIWAASKDERPDQRAN